MNVTRLRRHERERALMDKPDSLIENTCQMCRHIWRSRGRTTRCPVCCSAIVVYDLMAETRCLVCAKALIHWWRLPQLDYCSQWCRHSRSWKPPPASLPENNYLQLLPNDLRRMLLLYCNEVRSHRSGYNLLSGSPELNRHFPACDEQFFDPELFGRI